MISAASDKITDKQGSGDKGSLKLRKLGFFGLGNFLTKFDEN